MIIIRIYETGERNMTSNFRGIVHLLSSYVTVSNVLVGLFPSHADGNNGKFHYEHYCYKSPVGGRFCIDRSERCTGV
jgi:hypothetical protein